MGVFAVGAEGTAGKESVGGVEPPRGFELGLGAGLQAHAGVAPRAGLGEEVRQHRPRHPLAPVEVRRAHGLDLPVGSLQLPQRPAPHQLRVRRVVRPHRPERDVRPPQRRQVQRMHALRWRDAVHVAEVVREEGGDGGGG